MEFSITSELQTWPGKTQQANLCRSARAGGERRPARLLDLLDHRARYFFFPKFGASPNPFAFFAKASERARKIKFRTLLHVLPYHNPTVLASQIAQFDMLVDGRSNSASAAAMPGSRSKLASRSEESRARYEEALKIVIEALDKERFTHDGEVYQIKNRFAHRAAADVGPEVPHLSRRHEQFHLRARRRAGLCDGGAPAVALRGAARPARHLSRVLRPTRQQARHRLDSRLPSRP